MIAGRAFGHIADAAFGLDGIGCYVKAADMGAARIGFQKPCDHFHGGGFSGTIGAQKPQHFAPIHGERYPVHGLNRTKMLVQPVDFNHRCHELRDLPVTFL